MAALLKCSRRLGGKEDEMSVGKGGETKGDHIVVLFQSKKREERDLHGNNKGRRAQA